MTLFLVAGCGGDPPPPMSLDLALGTIDMRKNGDARWVDLVDDQTVELAPGAQGGFHIWLLYRVGGNNVMRKLKLERIAERLGDAGSRQRVLTTQTTVEIPAVDSWELPAPIPSFMCPTPIGVNILDAPLDFLVRLSVLETDEVLVEKHVRVQPACPPVGDSTRTFCLNICQG